jgi:hypothetical protein
MRISAAILAAGAAAVLAAGAGAAPALAAPSAPAGHATAAAAADSTISATYPVSGTTTLKKLNTAVALGPGSLAVTLDTTNSTLTANLSLPAATVSASVLGIPVTATTNFIQDGTATGTADLTTNDVTTTADETLQITSLKVGGLSIPVGNNCETVKPAAISVASQSGFNVLFGGTLAGTYSIPEFAHCGLATLLIDLSIPGGGNTISLNLGGATLAG